MANVETAKKGRNFGYGMRADAGDHQMGRLARSHVRPCAWFFPHRGNGSNAWSVWTTRPGTVRPGAANWRPACRSTRPVPDDPRFRVVRTVDRFMGAEANVGLT